jgi:taurine dioxygenase
VTSIRIKPLRDDLSFGVRVSGISVDNAADEDVRAEINQSFQASGLIVFEGAEPDNRTQAAISEIFAPLMGHKAGVPVDEGAGVDGFIEIRHDGVSEVDGTELRDFVPWHFDQCYASTLPRAGVLRALTIPPEGGSTGFADGIQIHQAISRDMRHRFETLNILYDSLFNFWNMKFGAPKSYRPVKIRREVVAQVATASRVRAVHPAIWERPTGEKVVHISPVQAAGIEGMETAEGDALLEAMCQAIYRAMRPYYHKWKSTDMVIWDNCRFIHSVTGHPPEYERDMRRTVIPGDYGLGRMEA